MKALILYHYIGSDDFCEQYTYNKKDFYEVMNCLDCNKLCVIDSIVSKAKYAMKYMEKVVIEPTRYF